MSRKEKLRVIVGLVIVGFIVQIADHFLLSSQGFHDNIYDFILSPIGRFDDFTLVSRLVSENNPYAFAISSASQFPFLYRMASVFALLPDRYSIAMFMSVFVAGFLIYSYRSVRGGGKVYDSINVLVLSCLSYPFLFTIARGNYEGILFLLLGLFAVLYRNGKTTLSVIPLSLAIAMKAFPAIFFMLFLSDKRYKDLALGIVFAALISLGSYASFDGGTLSNYTMHMANLKLYNADYAIGNGGLGYGHSLFGAIKIMVAHFAPGTFHKIVSAIFAPYAYFTFLMSVLLLGYVVLVEKELWKKIAILVFCMNMFPYVSADYKLIHIFIPLYLFINKTFQDRYDPVYAILFAALIVPKSYCYFKFDPSAAVIPYASNTAGLLNPMLMLVGVFVIVFSRIGRNCPASAE